MVHCQCQLPSHSRRELATGAYDCDRCNRFITCQIHDGNKKPLAEYQENGVYVCEKHLVNKSTKRWLMIEHV